MFRQRGRSVVLVLLIVTTVVYVVFRWSQDAPNINHRVLQDAKATGTKFILYWTPMFGQEDFYLGFGREIFQHCPVQDCFATNDRSLKPVTEFDAILFHGVEYFKNGRFGEPNERSEHQVYIYGNMEAESNSPAFGYLDDFYNWTMTYRLDSDVPRPYGYVRRLRPTDSPPKLPTAEDIRKRPKSIAWMVSNCNTASKRNELARNIEKYIPIDIYGHCGTHSCPKDQQKDCYDMLESTYKFYLSFENSYCTDYVTEKMYNVLQRNLIPVVYGGGNYSQLAPPHSVIDVSGFRTAKQLTDYLKELEEDVDEYLRYFEWKKTYTVTTEKNQTLCELCRKLHEPIRRKTYHSIKDWWAKGGCKYNNDLPDILFNA